MFVNLFARPHIQLIPPANALPQSTAANGASFPVITVDPPGDDNFSNQSVNTSRAMADAAQIRAYTTLMQNPTAAVKAAIHNTALRGVDASLAWVVYGTLSALIGAGIEAGMADKPNEAEAMGVKLVADAIAATLALGVVHPYLDRKSGENLNVRGALTIALDPKKIVQIARDPAQSPWKKFDPRFAALFAARTLFITALAATGLLNVFAAHGGDTKAEEVFANRCLIGLFGAVLSTVAAYLGVWWGLRAVLNEIPSDAHAALLTVKDSGDGTGPYAENNGAYLARPGNVEKDWPDATAERVFREQGAARALTAIPISIAKTVLPALLNTRPLDTTNAGLQALFTGLGAGLAMQLAVQYVWRGQLPVVTKHVIGWSMQIQRRAQNENISESSAALHILREKVTDPLSAFARWIAAASVFGGTSVGNNAERESETDERTDIEMADVSVPQADESQHSPLRPATPRNSANSANTIGTLQPGVTPRSSRSSPPRSQPPSPVTPPNRLSVPYATRRSSSDQSQLSERSRRLLRELKETLQQRPTVELDPLLQPESPIQASPSSSNVALSEGFLGGVGKAARQSGDSDESLKLSSDSPVSPFLLRASEKSPSHYLNEVNTVIEQLLSARNKFFPGRPIEQTSGNDERAPLLGRSHREEEEEILTILIRLFIDDPRMRMSLPGIGVESAEEAVLEAVSRELRNNPSFASECRRFLRAMQGFSELSRPMQQQTLHAWDDLDVLVGASTPLS